MADPLYISGEWVGYYTYEKKPAKCPMHLTLHFEEGAIKGAGMDTPGTFVIQGTYDNTAAKWVKQYLGKHSVQYEGACSDDEITGTWLLPRTAEGKDSSLRGNFRIWLLPDDMYGDDEMLASILEREIRRKTQA